MKKNLLTIVLLGTAAAAAISCSNKDNLEPAASERVPMQFSAGTPAITKTAIAEDGTSVVWSEGDAIGIFDTQINKFDLIAGDGTSEGRFSGFALPDAEYYALYPYDETASIAGGIISATLPSAQYSTADGTFSTMLNPAVAKADASNSLAFDYVAAMMKVNVTGVTGDVKSISRAQGIGQKTAQRVILDLKDKIGNEFMTGGGRQEAAGGDELLRAQAGGTAVSEAIDALTVLGYTRIEAGRAVRRLDIPEDAGTEDILKAALRIINK